MATGNNSSPRATEITEFLSHQESRYAKLDERVNNLSQRMTGIDERIGGVANAINTLASETRNSLATMAADFRNAQAPKWQAISVGVTFILAIGGLAYWPIATSTTDLKASVAKLTDLQASLVVSLPDKFIPRAESERIAKWAEQQRSAMQDRVDKLYDKVDRLEDLVAEQKAKP